MGTTKEISASQRKADERSAETRAKRAKSELESKLQDVAPWERKLRAALYHERLPGPIANKLYGKVRRRQLGLHGTGLKPTLDQVQASLIMQAIRVGNFPEVAAQAQGVERVKWFEWMRIGQQWIDDNPVASVIDWRALIVLAVHEAEAMHEASCVGRLDVAGKEDWKATESVLTKRHRQRWGERGTNIADLGIKRIVLEGSDPSSVETEDQELARRERLRHDDA